MGLLLKRKPINPACKDGELEDASEATSKVHTMAIRVATWQRVYEVHATLSCIILEVVQFSKFILVARVERVCTLQTFKDTFQDNLKIEFCF